jgi:hypothetical protein
MLLSSSDAAISDLSQFRLSTLKHEMGSASLTLYVVNDAAIAPTR